MKLFVTALLVIDFVLFAELSHAEPGLGDEIIHELRGGILAHDVGFLWSGSNREDGLDINLEVIFSPSLIILKGTLRPSLGASLNTGGDTSKVYLDGRWQYDFENCVFASLSLGSAYHNGEKNRVSIQKKALGSRFLFHVALEGGCYFGENSSVSIYFDHISNAGIRDENAGLDTLGVRYGYSF
jgi:lipid A 3-O-deacylase